jgi:NAD(P)H-dependent FMN reductase
MPDRTLNVIAICGSLRRGSYNRMVMQALPGLAPEGMPIKEARLVAESPVFVAIEDGNRHSSTREHGEGDGPLKAETRVRIPLGP